MKKIHNLFTTLLLAATALTLGSCTEEYEYTAATVEGEQVYFSNTLPSTVELSATENSITVPVNRIDKNGELTVPLTVSVPEGSSLTVSDQVTFADGESEAYVTISYDPNTIEYGKYEQVTVSLEDASYTTPYGSSSYTFSAGLSEWKTMSGTATYRDGLMGASYDLETLSYPVEIEENVLTPGMYRIVNPYGESSGFFEEYGDGKTGDGTFTAYDENNHYLIIDATDPDYVYVYGDNEDASFTPGVKYNDDSNEHLLFYSYVTYCQVARGDDIETIKATDPTVFGKLEDGVITMPANSFLMELNTDQIGGGSDGSIYYANSTGEFAIALPGYSIRDYSASFVYTGRFDDTDNTSYAQGTITLGGDVATAKYVLAADGDDLSAIEAGIKDGSIECEEITQSGNVSIPAEGGGYYTIVIVTYDADGEAQDTYTYEFAFRGQSSADNWEPLYSGVMTYGQYPLFEDLPTFYDSTFDGAAVIYENKSLPGQYMLAPYGESEDGLIFRMKPDNTITFTGVDTGSKVTLQLVDGTSLDDVPVAAQDLDVYYGSVTGAGSFFNGRMFVFSTVYYTEYGAVAASQELFTITGTADASYANSLKAVKKGKLEEKTFKVKHNLKRKVAKVSMSKFNR